jgi:energy-coupling factor transporter ATP-binding protein EcfA2
MERCKQFIQHLNYNWDEWKQRASHHLSGGEWQILQHSLAMAVDPKVYLLDETLAAIDQHKRKLIMQFYLEQVKEKQKSVLLIDHHSLNISEIQEKNFLRISRHLGGGDQN